MQNKKVSQNKCIHENKCIIQANITEAMFFFSNLRDIKENYLFSCRLSAEIHELGIGRLALTNNASSYS